MGAQHSPTHAIEYTVGCSVREGFQITPDPSRRNKNQVKGHYADSHTYGFSPPPRSIKWDANVWHQGCVGHVRPPGNIGGSVVECQPRTHDLIFWNSGDDAVEDKAEMLGEILCVGWQALSMRSAHEIAPGAYYESTNQK
ncbi:MAG: hypothetical protein NVSMB28_25480 [Collimonas sp.]